VSKLADYLKKQKIDPRRVVVASRRLEALRPEDRAVRRARGLAREGDEAAKELAQKPCRAGRPVTRPLMARSLRGEAISRGAKKRLLRAVNAVLAQKKKPEVAATDLF
jgi:hypothetical protein